eukprot:scaffold1038_cov274-Prasinococcus_capsulatus_cf.AAC.3
MRRARASAPAAVPREPRPAAHTRSRARRSHGTRPAAGASRARGQGGACRRARGAAARLRRLETAACAVVDVVVVSGRDWGAAAGGWRA